MVEQGKRYLEHVYSKGKVVHGDYTHRLTDEIVSRFISREVCEGGRLSMLDVGCGMGGQAKAFSRYFTMYGTDISDKASELFEESAVPFTFKACNFEIERLPFPDDFFCIIFSKSLIEHINNTDKLMADMYRVLKPGGICILMTPAWETQYKHFYDDYTHVKPFTRHGLRSALCVNNFSNVNVTEFYQLPYVWKYPFLKILPIVISKIFPDSFKFKGSNRSTARKWIRFSKETMLLGFGKKS